MSAHTPGPWRCCVGTGATEVRGEPVGDIPNPRVCRVLRSDQNAYANARLIAAAPNLLTALAELVACKDLKALAGSISPVEPGCEKELLNDEYRSRQPKAWERARAAIAQAEGA